MPPTQAEIDQAVRKVGERVAAMTEARNSAQLCPKGGSHSWTYGSGWYRCTNCGYGISKPDLKAATDRDVIEIHF